MKNENLQFMVTVKDNYLYTEKDLILLIKN